LAVPESLTSAAEKPRTGSLKETVNRAFERELGLGWPAARFTFTVGRVQSWARAAEFGVEAVATAGTATNAANNTRARNRFDIGYPDLSIGPNVCAQIPRSRGGRRVSLELVTHYPKWVFAPIRIGDRDGANGCYAVTA